MNAHAHSNAFPFATSRLRVKTIVLARVHACTRRLPAFAAFRAGSRVRAPARTCHCQLWQLSRVAALSIFLTKLTKLTKLTHPPPPLADSSAPPRYAPAAMPQPPSPSARKL